VGEETMNNYTNKNTNQVKEMEIVMVRMMTMMKNTKYNQKK